MAHNLYKNSMVYAGETPWHGLGTKLPANATWEQISQLGGFYTAQAEKVFTAGGKEIEGKRAITRADTGDALAVVSDSYCIVQFADVARTLTAAAQGVDAIFHTAGLLGEHGKRGWLLAELPRVLRVKGDDSEIRPYILGTAAHDGHHGVNLRNVATRVVCQNTLGVAMAEESKFMVSIHHTKNAMNNLRAAEAAFHTLLQGMDDFEVMANVLAATKFTDKQMAKTIDAMLPVDANKEKPSKALTEKREKVAELFEAGTGISAGIRGTAWAAFQAWTEYADHFKAARTDDAAKRLESVWLGSAATMKQDAFGAIQKALMTA